jgi:CRISPR-associated endonuclease/helicase Cas3
LEEGASGEGDDSHNSADDTETQDPGTEQAAPPAKALQHGDIVALIISPDGTYDTQHDRSSRRRYTLAALGQDRKGKAREEFQQEITGKILIVDARFGGLKDGMLDPSSGAAPETADTAPKWNEEAQFRVRPVEALDEGSEEEWRFEDAFLLQRDAEGTPRKWLRVEHLKDSARKEDARSVAKPQTLGEHQDWARREMLRIAKGVGVSGLPANALAVAAALHDEGKKADRWQRAFKASRDAQRFGLSRPLAKTRGPIDQALLDGYRHEFGSLRYVEENAEFNQLPVEWRDLVLHLVAAHHGFARPVIDIRGCDDGPPSLLEERARDVAMRFARLQKRWGPWVLAWWEALLRAADAQASRDNDEGRAPETEKG